MTLNIAHIAKYIGKEYKCYPCSHISVRKRIVYWKLWQSHSHTSASLIILTSCFVFCDGIQIWFETFAVRAYIKNSLTRISGYQVEALYQDEIIHVHIESNRRFYMFSAITKNKYIFIKMYKIILKLFDKVKMIDKFFNFVKILRLHNTYIF